MRRYRTHYDVTARSCSYSAKNRPRMENMQLAYHYVSFLLSRSLTLFAPAQRYKMATALLFTQTLNKSYTISKPCV